MINSDDITKIIYTFGSPHIGKYGVLTLKPDGIVDGYKHTNETFWELSTTGLNFLSQRKKITSSFSYIESIQSWFGNTTNKQKSPLYLYPLLNTKKDYLNKELPPVVLNGIPYNGAIFFEKALARCGWSSSNINLIGNDIVDVTEINDTTTQKKRLSCSVDIVPPLLTGQTLLGNIDCPKAIKSIHNNNVLILTLVRNIKDTILEFFELEVNKQSNNFLRPLYGNKQAEKFIELHGDGMLLHMRNVARALVNDNNKIILHYENNISGRIPDDIAAFLDKIQPDTANNLTKELPKAYAEYMVLKPTITRAVKWSEPLEEYCRTVGLMSFNHILGYLD
jgi:hypothetical protein